MNEEITFRNFEIPFSSKEEEIWQIIHKILSDNPTLPPDLYGHIYDVRPQKTYYPMAFFSGTYQGSWTCETYHREEKVVVRRNSENISYLDSEVHRVADNAGNSIWGNFSTIIPAASENNPLASLLDKFTKDIKPDIFFNSGKKEIDNPASSDGVDYIEKRLDLEEFWHINGKKLINEDVRRDAKEQLAGRSYSGLRVSFRHELSNPVSILYIPFWTFFYSYGGKQYHIIIDDSSHKELSSKPTDEKIITLNKRITEINNELSAGCAICVIFAIITGLVAYFCAEGAMGLALGITVGALFIITAIIFEKRNDARNKPMTHLLQQHIDKINYVREHNERIWINQGGVEKMIICTIPSASDIISRSLSIDIYNFVEATPPPLPNTLLQHPAANRQVLANTALGANDKAQVILSSDKKRSTFVLLGIFFGLVGAHNFYAGYTARAVTQLVLTLLLFFFTAPFVFLWNIIECCVVKKDVKGLPFR